MTGSKVVQFFLLISLMIFYTYAAKRHVILAEGQGPSSFFFETDIKVGYYPSGMRYYNGYEGSPHNFTAKATTKNVIVYIMEIAALRSKLENSDFVSQIKGLSKDTLKPKNYQLIFLGIDNSHIALKHRDAPAIGEFLLEAIKFTDASPDHIHTIGEGDQNLVYRTSRGDLDKFDDGKCGLWANVEGTIRTFCAPDPFFAPGHL